MPLGAAEWRVLALPEWRTPMESRKAVSNFQSCCKALVEIIPPGHHLTDLQESIVLSNLQVLESAIRVSHLQESTAVYHPNPSGAENNPCSMKRLTMEVLVRWKCFCITSANLLKYVKNRTYLILARRESGNAVVVENGGLLGISF